MQWQPNDANLINLDLLYSDFNAKRDENFLEAFSFSRTAAQGGKPQTIVRGGEIDANGTLVYGVFNDVDIRSESRYDELETKFYSVTLRPSTSSMSSGRSMNWSDIRVRTSTIPSRPRSRWIAPTATAIRGITATAAGCRTSTTTST